MGAGTLLPHILLVGGLNLKKTGTKVHYMVFASAVPMGASNDAVWTGPSKTCDIKPHQSKTVFQPCLDALTRPFGALRFAAAGAEAAERVERAERGAVAATATATVSLGTSAAARVALVVTALQDMIMLERNGIIDYSVFYQTFTGAPRMSPLHNARRGTMGPGVLEVVNEVSLDERADDTTKTVKVGKTTNADEQRPPPLPSRAASSLLPLPSASSTPSIPSSSSRSPSSAAAQYHVLAIIDPLMRNSVGRWFESIAKSGTYGSMKFTDYGRKSFELFASYFACVPRPVAALMWAAAARTKDFFIKSHVQAVRIVRGAWGGGAGGHDAGEGGMPQDCAAVVGDGGAPLVVRGYQRASAAVRAANKVEKGGG